MITEKQKEAVREVCRNVSDFCRANGLELFMIVSANEETSGIHKQDIGSCIMGTPDHISRSLAELMEKEPRFTLMLQTATEILEDRLLKETSGGDTPDADAGTDVHTSMN